jgi:phage gp36-like protein
MRQVYWSLADLKPRIPEGKRLEIFDRDLDGVEDDEIIDDYRVRSAVYVDAKLSGAFTLPFATVPDEIRRHSLDVAIAMMGMDMPELFRVDYLAKMKLVDTALDALRKAHQGTGDKPPDPAKNHGGMVGTGTTNPWKSPVFGKGWGGGIF